MNSTADRIVSLLGQGYSQATVAAALGVTPSYVSQVAETPEVREEVSRLRVGKLQERVVDDETLETTERRALKLISDKMVFVKSPAEAANIFKILNNAKRKTAANAPENDAASIESVTIVLPKSAAAIHIQLNGNNQVIEVEGRSMAPLPSRALHNLRRPVEELPAMEVTRLVDASEQRSETTKRLNKDDALAAARRLSNLEVIIDGVPCVL